MDTAGVLCCESAVRGNFNNYPLHTTELKLMYVKMLRLLLLPHVKYVRIFKLT